MNIDFNTIKDADLAKLIDNRWQSSEEIWDTIKRVYKSNTAIYENKPDWLTYIPHVRLKYKVQANRIFVNMEAVINSLIANPAGVNVLPGRDGEESQDIADKIESYMRKKFDDLNVKETMRMGLRNLYFGRLLVIKAFWNPAINDFDFRSLKPEDVRFGKHARKEQDSEFAIEEIEDNLCALIERFPAKKSELMKKFGFTDDDDGSIQLYIKNPDVKYKEAWIQEYVCFKLDNIILGKIKNPYWDWDGIMITEEEAEQINGKNALAGEQRRNLLQKIKIAQDSRVPNPGAATESPEIQANSDQNGSPAPIPQNEGAVQADETGATPENQEEQQEAGNYQPYFFNYFDHPRKPYIFATILNNENSPIGRTDMITLSSDLQRGINKRKMDIDENCELVNGIIKVDSAVMGKSDAQRMRFETKGIVWGKGVKDGVTRETGTPLPDMVFKDMEDSRAEIDNIMAASSAFRGERQGQETKAGRLALIQQSYLRLNELVQVVDYVYKEMFEWAMQLAKCRYTEYHYAKWLGHDEAQKIIELIQDDFENGSEVKIISGKTLPQDDEFKFEQAQNDVAQGFISPVDYLRIAKYDDPKELSKNAVLYKQNPAQAVGLNGAEMPLPAQPGQLQPAQAAELMNAGLPPALPANAPTA